jgi:hypothetical protein
LVCNESNGWNIVLSEGAQANDGLQMTDYGKHYVGTKAPYTLHSTTLSSNDWCLFSSCAQQVGRAIDFCIAEGRLVKVGGAMAGQVEKRREKRSMYDRFDLENKHSRVLGQGVASTPVAVCIETVLLRLPLRAGVGCCEQVVGSGWALLSDGSRGAFYGALCVSISQA